MRVFLYSMLPILVGVAAMAQTGSNIEVVTEVVDGKQVLRHEVTVPGKLEDVWNLFTTSKGCQSWMTPVAYIDFKEGGIGETSYSADAKPGDPANIVSRYLEIEPLKRYTSKLIKAPADNPYGSVLMDLHSEVTFQDLGDNQVKVGIAMIGWDDSQEHQQVMGFFKQGNSWYCERLIKRCKEGPLPWDGFN